jgi:hypothetical protein
MLSRRRLLGGIAATGLLGISRVARASAFDIVFLDSRGNVATPAERAASCITASALHAGTNGTFSVTLKNIGDASCGLLTVEFFLKTPSHGAQALPSSLCTPASNPLAPTTLDVNESQTFSIEYTVQGPDVGACTVYAQFQTVSPPPGTDPTNMNLVCNAKRAVNILP